MITSIEIENFKAFGNRQRIDLAPITLIYGENSAGKTSILQAIHLLKQTHESRDSGAALLPRAEDGIVDLGSFKELLFDHDVTRSFRFAVELAPASPNRTNRAMRTLGLAGDTPLGLEAAFRQDKTSREVTWSEIKLSLPGRFPGIGIFTPKNLTDIEQLRAQRYGLGAIGPRQARRRQLTGAECTWVAEEDRLWAPYFQSWHGRRTEIASELKRAVDRRMRQGVGDIGEDDENEVRDWSKDVLDAARFYDRDFTLSDFIQRMRRLLMGTVIATDGVIPSGFGIPGGRRIPELNLLEFSALRSAIGIGDLPFLDIGKLAWHVGRLFEESLTSLFPMGPFRRPPERWYIFTGTSPLDVGYKGDHLPDLLFRRPDLVEQANEWMKRLDIGYRVKVQPIGEAASDLFEVRLFDARRSQPVDVGLSDVGFGISQILPFIVQALASRDQLISIEQPEVHIHPRLQADLGDLIAEATRVPFCNRFLIETHSEHIVLRIQRLVRNKYLSPADVSINYVTRGKLGSVVHRLRLNEQGEFVDEWPNGFFPERLRELS